MFEQQQFEFMDDGTALKRLFRELCEYAGLFLTFFKLYLQGRILVAQNLFLTCKLQLWEIVFLYVRVQVFLMRLARGFPVTECWPQSRSEIRR